MKQCRKELAKIYKGDKGAMNQKERNKAWTVGIRLDKPGRDPVQGTVRYFATEKEARRALRATRKALAQKR